MRINEHDDEQMGAGNEFPFEENEVKKDGKTRKELEELSNKDLAKIAEPLQDRYSFSSLKGRSKNYLIDIILGVNGDDVKPVNKPTGKAPQSASESQDILTMGLSVLEAFKKQREGEKALLNPIAQELFISSAVSKVDEARAEGALKTDKFQTALLALSATALVVDGVIGFDNIPGHLSKLKAKFSKKA